MKLSIIIVNFNTSTLVNNCVESIKKYWKQDAFEFIIVDNSEDENEIAAADKLLNNQAGIKFLHVKNEGYGAANNRGAKLASGEFLLFLNPDTIMTDDSVLKITDILKNNRKIGALSPLIYQENNKTLQHHFYGDFQSLAGIIFKKWQGRQIDLTKELTYVDMVTGACLLIRKSLFDHLHGFDENFFMYIEDDDLCKRVAEAGYKNAIYSKARIIHLEGASSTSVQKRLMYYRSQDYYFKKHYGVLRMRVMQFIRWPYKILKILLAK